MKLTFKSSAGRFYDFIGDIRKYKSIESYLTALLKFMSSSKAKANINFIPQNMTVNDIQIINDDNIDIANFDKAMRNIKPLANSKKMFENDNIEIDAHGFDRRLDIHIKT